MQRLIIHADGTQLLFLPGGDSELAMVIATFKRVAWRRFGSGRQLRADPPAGPGLLGHRDIDCHDSVFYVVPF